MDMPSGKAYDNIGNTIRALIKALEALPEVSGDVAIFYSYSITEDPTSRVFGREGDFSGWEAHGLLDQHKADMRLDSREIDSN